MVFSKFRNLEIVQLPNHMLILNHNFRTWRCQPA